MDDDLAQQRQGRLESSPYPLGQVFAGRILESGNIIQIAMIQLLEDRGERRLDIRKIHHPASVGIRLAGDVDFHAEGMPMQACTFVPGGNIGQAVRRFDLKTLENVHAVGAVLKQRVWFVVRGRWAAEIGLRRVRELSGFQRTSTPVESWE